MVIPEFILRKLFVKGSLKKGDVGFSFCINNTFAPATLLSVGLDVDGTAIGKDKLAMGRKTVNSGLRIQLRRIIPCLFQSALFIP